MSVGSATVKLVGVPMVLVALVACGGKADRRDKSPTLGEQMDEAKDRWAIDSARLASEGEAAAAPSDAVSMRPDHHPASGESTPPGQGTTRITVPSSWSSTCSSRGCAEPGTVNSQASSSAISALPEP